MNSFREAAEDDFRQQRFFRRHCRYDVVTIGEGEGKGAEDGSGFMPMRNASMTIEEIPSAVAAVDQGDAAAAENAATAESAEAQPHTSTPPPLVALTLVKVLFEQGSVAQTFHGSREDILNLFDIFGIDTCMLSMVSRRQCAFYRVGSSFYWKASSFMLVWTTTANGGSHRSGSTSDGTGGTGGHDASSSTGGGCRGLNGVIFVRNIRRAHEDAEQYLNLLHSEHSSQQQQQRVAALIGSGPRSGSNSGSPPFFSPLLPMLVGAIQVSGSLGKMVRERAALIKEVESATTVHPWRNVTTTPPPYHTTAASTLSVTTTTKDENEDGTVEGELRRLAGMSQAMGASLVKLEHLMRQLRHNRQALTAFGLGDITTTSGQRSSPPPRRRNFGGGSAAAAAAAAAAPVVLDDAVRLLEAQFANTELDIEYLRERAKNQLSVIFNLMTRDEAWASISLARSAKQDGTSMKVIAVMTMAFLPATAIAALFATPWLGAIPLVQESPWVFWACAVPCTAAVFGLWVVLTRRDRLLCRRYYCCSPASPRSPRPVVGMHHPGGVELKSSGSWGSGGNGVGSNGGGGDGDGSAGGARGARGLGLLLGCVSR